MNRDIPRYVAAAVLTLLAAALVVAVGSNPSVSTSLYVALVAVGALLALGGVAVHPTLDRELTFALWPPWLLALLLDPSAALALGFLAGGVGGLLVVPAIAWLDRRDGAAAG